MNSELMSQIEDYAIALLFDQNFGVEQRVEAVFEHFEVYGIQWGNA